MKIKLTSLLATIALVAHVQARTWTSADGSKTFKADYISHTENSVVVMKGLKRMNFKTSLLSEADRDWLKEQGQKSSLEPDEKAEPTADELGEFGNNIKNDLVIFEGKRYSKHKLESAPDYYLIYFTASW